MRLEQLVNAILDRFHGPLNRARDPERANRMEIEFINPHAGRSLPPLLQASGRQQYYVDTSQFNVDGFYYRNPNNLRNNLITLRLIWDPPPQEAGNAATPIGR